MPTSRPGTCGDGHPFTNKREPVPADIEAIFSAISHHHGPSRYAHGKGEISVGLTHLESSPEFDKAIGEMDFSVVPDRGEGAIWGWFVGSPRAFLFGFERTKSWASRRLRMVVRQEVALCRELQFGAE